MSPEQIGNVSNLVFSGRISGKDFSSSEQCNPNPAWNKNDIQISHAAVRSVQLLWTSIIKCLPPLKNLFKNEGHDFFFLSFRWTLNSRLVLALKRRFYSFQNVVDVRRLSYLNKKKQEKQGVPPFKNEVYSCAHNISSLQRNIERIMWDVQKLPSDVGCLLYSEKNFTIRLSRLFFLYPDRLTSSCGHVYSFLFLTNYHIRQTLKYKCIVQKSGRLLRLLNFTRFQEPYA